MGTPSASPSQSVSQSASSSRSASPSVTPSASPSAEQGDEQVVTLAEAKAHLNVTASDDDVLIDAYIDAATRWASKYQNRKYITEPLVEYFDRWPRVIRPQWSPLIAITSIRYIDSSGVWQTLDAAAYIVDAASEPGRIVEAYGYSWPGVRGDANGIEVTYTAGYGALADDVPAEVRHAILLLVGDWYGNREDIVTGTIVSNIPTGVKALLGMERMTGV